MAQKRNEEQLADGDKSEVLKLARKAAIECCDAGVAFLEDAMRPSGESRARDYREHLSRLYGAARRGWEPICRCWPELVEHADRFYADDAGPADADQLPLPVQMWLLSAFLFWRTIFGFGHVTSGTRAWKEWSDDFMPDDEFDILTPSADSKKWDSFRDLAGLPSVFRQSDRDRFRDAMKVPREDIWVATPSAKEPLTARRIPAKPPRPFPKPLPTSRRGLERLLVDLNTLIPAHDTMNLRSAEIIHALRSQTSELQARFASFSAAASELGLVRVRCEVGLVPYLEYETSTVRHCKEKTLKDLQEAAKLLAADSPPDGEVLPERTAEAWQTYTDAFQTELRLAVNHRNVLAKLRERIEAELSKFDTEKPSDLESDDEQADLSKKRGKKPDAVVRQRRDLVKKCAATLGYPPRQQPTKASREIYAQLEDAPEISQSGKAFSENTVKNDLRALGLTK